jgi:murein DD-endopeptidase MepM/ murein hydrolase activator NlpD
LVVGEPGARTIQWGEGLPVESYTRDDQPSADPVRANASGWNCRVHLEYEGQPAVDWYFQSSTPIIATMDGVATLYVITISNAFDYYGIAREPYMGNPDRTRAPLAPFPGPSGGKGVFVLVENDGFAAEYAHLDLQATLSLVPPNAFLPGYSASADYSTFGAMRDFRASTPIARWRVSSGDVIGLSGDSGYSEAPHLHYTIRRSGGASLLCPTDEAGFVDGGWLFK